MTTNNLLVLPPSDAWDVLSGLLDRRGLVESLNRALAAGQESGAPSAILLIDVKAFRRINSTFGHYVGDVVLAALATRLEALTDEGDCVGRFAGDVFVIIAKHVASVGAVAGLVQRVCAVVSEPIAAAGAELGVTCVVGVALSDGSACAERLFTRADSALARAKRLRLPSQFFDATMSREAHRRLAVEARLPLALERGEFTVHYQPVVDVAGQYVIGVETLARWTDAELGPIPPPLFIAVAEARGLGQELGRIIQDTAVSDRAELARLYDNDGLWVSLNTSPKQLRTTATIETLRQSMVRHGVSPGQLALEVIEDLVLDGADTLPVVDAARRLGIKVALDDFGTGQGSLAHLLAVPCDSVKIDRSFIARITESRRSRSIVAGLIWMCLDSGLEVIAEGVETSEQLSWLGEYGCHRIQGYYLARPASLGDLRRRAAVAEPLVQNADLVGASDMASPTG